MRGKAHLACGIISGAGISAVCHFDILSSLLITGASAFFSLVPDIDHPDSMLGHLIKPVSKFIKEKIGHRTLTHSGLWLILYAFLLYRFYNTFLFPVILGATIGFASHLISDTFTIGGVPWTWPISKKKTHLTKVYSGSKDGIFVVLTGLIITGAGYMVVNYENILNYLRY